MSHEKQHRMVFLQRNQSHDFMKWPQWYFFGDIAAVFFLSEQKKLGGPLLVISRGEITPLIVGWNSPSETHLFSAIKKGFTFGTLMSWRLNGWGWLLSEWNVEDWSFNPKRSSSIVIGLNTCLVGGVTRTQAIAFKSLMLKRSVYNSSRKAEMERIALKQPRLRKDVHQSTHNWLLPNWALSESFLHPTIHWGYSVILSISSCLPQDGPKVISYFSKTREITPLISGWKEPKLPPTHLLQGHLFRGYFRDWPWIIVIFQWSFSRFNFWHLGSNFLRNVACHPI